MNQLGGLVLPPPVKLPIFLSLHQNVVFLSQEDLLECSGSSLPQLVQSCILPETELCAPVQSPIEFMG